MKNEKIKLSEYAKNIGIKYNTALKQYQNNKLQGKWQAVPKGKGNTLYVKRNISPFRHKSLQDIQNENKKRIEPILKFLKDQDSHDAVMACKLFIESHRSSLVIDMPRLETALNHAADNAKSSDKVFDISIRFKSEGIDGYNWTIIEAKDPEFVISNLPPFQKSFTVLWQQQVQQRKAGNKPIYDSPYPIQLNSNWEHISQSSWNEMQKYCCYCLKPADPFFDKAQYQICNSCQEPYRKWIDRLAKKTQTQIAQEILKRLKPLQG